MATKERESYDVKGYATTGEAIALTVNSTSVFSDTVPAWATKAEIYFKVIFTTE